MKCAYCGSNETKVLDKRESDESTTNRRRRECLRCSKRFTTYERIEEIEGANEKITQVKKRNGTIALFNQDKITNAIFKSIVSTGGTDKNLAKELCSKVIKYAEEEYTDKIPTVENIQDLVEKVLVEEKHAKIAKAFIIYREKHQRIRETKSTLLDVKNTISEYLNKSDWRVNENSNEDYSFSGLLLHVSGKVIANYALSEIYPTDVTEAYKNGHIHIHDLSHGFIGYCAGWSLKNLLIQGFGGVQNKTDANPAKHMGVVVHQMVNFIGCLQMEFAGAQAFSSVDTLLAPFVKTDNMDYKQVKQCMQELIYSLNVPSRWGCVTPDTDILTLNGWKNYKELKINDKIWSLDLKTQKIIKDKIKKINIYDFNGDLIKLSNRSQEQLLTPNHRVIRCEYNKDSLIATKAENLLKFNSPISLPVSRENNNKDFKISDDELKLYAWIISEGSIDFGERVGRERITIHQSPIKNLKYCKEIESILSRLGIIFSSTFILGGFGKGANRYRLGRTISKKLVQCLGRKKEIPMNILRKCSAKQIKLFLEEYRKGDGSKERFRIYTKDKQTKEDLQELCALSGFGSSTRLNKNKIFVINIHLNKNQTITKKEKIKYSGKVWCPTTNTSTWIARRKGNVFITGNSQYPFTNLTFDWKVPGDMKNEKCIVGGKEQNFTYNECQKEMDMVNKAFLEVMSGGDANGRIFTFPIPTYNITRDFEWDTENANLLFEVTAKYGLPYFQNYVGSNLDPSSIRAMCCRLNIDQNELMNRPGNMWGPGDNTGSIGVVTINMNRLGYECKTKEEFMQKLRYYMDLGKQSLEIKRRIVNKNLENGLMPFTKRYLGTFKNHFSTIGLCGMNECCLNFLQKDISTEEGKEFTIETLKFMRDVLKDFQRETGQLYNLEATPAESTSYKLAKSDIEHHPDIITAGETHPFLSNSTQLPVNHTNDVIEAIEHQNDIQPLYTGGTIFHTFLGEQLSSGEACKQLVKKIATNTRLPYFSITPTFSICKNHGYLKGNLPKCPECNEETEVYSRIVGYFRPVKRWNDGKKEEWKFRKTYEEKIALEREMKNLTNIETIQKFQK